MPHRIDPTLFARRYAFEGTDCLYRDHRGHRVLADWEGPGRAVVEQAPAGLEFEPGGGCAHTLAPGSSCIFVLVGPPEPLPSSHVALEGMEGAFEGCGWVVGAEGSLRVDDRREIAPVPSPETPVPFMMRAEADRLDIVRRPFRTRLLDRFCVDDAQALAQRSFRVQNISDCTALDSTFADGTPHVARVASHLNTAAWNVDVPPGCHALLLRKTYDRFHGRQRARVMIDGHPAGWWYDPVEDRSRRWGVSDFLVPSALCQPGVREISVDPVAGSPLWSITALEVFGIERV